MPQPADAVGLNGINNSILAYQRQFGQPMSPGSSYASIMNPNRWGQTVPKAPPVPGQPGAGQQGMYGSVINPRPIYSPDQTAVAANQLLNQGMQSAYGSNPLHVEDGISTNSPAMQAQRAAYGARAIGQAEGNAEGLRVGDAAANAQNLLAGQTARAGDILGQGQNALNFASSRFNYGLGNASLLTNALMGFMPQGYGMGGFGG